MPDDVLDHDHGAVYNHAEVQRSEREQVGRNVIQVKAYRGEQKRERYRQCNDQCPANVAKEQEQDDDDQEDALRQILEHRVRCELQKIGPVEEGDNLHARRENVVVQFLHLRMNPCKRSVGVLTLLQQHNPFHRVRVVEQFSVNVDGY